MSDLEKLIKAVKKGDCEKVTQLLDNPDINPNQLEKKSGKSILQIVIENRDESMFEVLLKCKRMNFQISSADGQFPLETAIVINQLYFVNKLLQQNINPRKKNAEGQTAIQIAVKNQTNAQILKKLFVYNFDVNQKVGIHGSLLNLSIISKQLDNFLIVLSQPTIKILIKDDENNTCLILAVKSNIGEMVRQILQKISQNFTQIERQFFINAQNNEGNTALHLAYINNSQTITKLIEDYGKKLGIDRTLKNRKGMTVDDIINKREKDKILEKEQEDKKIIEKKIRQKEKEQEKERIRIQQQRQLRQEKRLKKQAEIRQAAQIENKKKQTFSKTVWIMGIIFVIVVGVMYLAIVNAIQKEKLLKN